MSERDSETGPGRGNRPVETVRDSALKVSIFRNQSERGPYYSMTSSRIYTDEKTGEVRETHSLSGSEPLRMAHLLTKAYERAGKLREQDRESERDRDTRDPDDRTRGPDRGRPRTRSRRR